MIRKFYKTIAAVCMCAAMAGCEDYLDMAPDENLTIGDVFSNRLYTRDFLTHIYSWTPTEANMADDGGAWRNPYTVGCDEMESANVGAYGQQINNGGWNPTDIKRTQVWPESYMALRKVNMFLANVDKCPTNETEKLHWKGEAYFLRAWFHFLVFRAYGPIPLLDHALDPGEDMMSIRRSPADECAKFIAADCDRAYELLKDVPRWGSTDTGRATSLSALGLKSRVLHARRGGRKLFDKYPDDPAKNYQQLFVDNWNDEILWAKNLGTYSHWLDCGDPVSFGCYSILNPTQEMVDAYEMANGLAPITGYTNDGMTPIINPESGYREDGFAAEASDKGWSQEGVSNMYVGREPRFYASINFAGAIWKTSRASNWTQPHTLEFWFHGIDGKGHAGSDYCKTGYLMKKLLYPTRVPWQYTPLMQWVYIRLGEMYLNYAEAINEYEGPAKAYAYVNDIRKRAGLPELPRGLSKEQMRERIRHERRIEVAFEVHRFFDVRRWLQGDTQGKPIHSMNIYAGGHMQDPAFYQRIKVEDRVFEAPKHYLFPIDQVEIDKNQRRLLVQNPGWTTSVDN